MKYEVLADDMAKAVLGRLYGNFTSTDVAVISEIIRRKLVDNAKVIG